MHAINNNYYNNNNNNDTTRNDTNNANNSINNNGIIGFNKDGTAIYSQESLQFHKDQLEENSIDDSKFVYQYGYDFFVPAYSIGRYRYSQKGFATRINR